MKLFETDDRDRRVDMEGGNEEQKLSKGQIKRLKEKRKKAAAKEAENLPAGYPPMPISEDGATLEMMEAARAKLMGSGI